MMERWTVIFSLNSYFNNRHPLSCSRDGRILRVNAAGWGAMRATRPWPTLSRQGKDAKCDVGGRGMGMRDGRTASGLADARSTGADAMGYPRYPPKFLSLASSSLSPVRAWAWHGHVYR